MQNIFLLGDTHGDWENFRVLFKKHFVRPGDMVIVLGDFGFIWDTKFRQQTNALQRDFALAQVMLGFIDGNHENFEILNSFPTEIWNGGLIHRIDKNIVHLMRGQVFDFFGKSFFTMGGAASIDWINRQNRISWWNEENITNADMAEADKNLNRVGNKVDYVLTHTCPKTIADRMHDNSHFTFDDSNTRLLEDIFQTIEFDKWYFGHMHEDRTFNRFTCVYAKIVKIDFQVNLFIEKRRKLCYNIYIRKRKGKNK